MKTRRNSEKAIAAGVGVALVLGLGGCASYKSFKDEPGDILAGYTTTVESKWYSSHYNSKSGRRGYVLYLRSEDCPAGVQPTPGVGQITPGCKEQDHQVDLDGYLKFNDGSGVVWGKSDGNSIVEQHRRAERSTYSTVYNFALRVTQCLDQPVGEHPAGCVTDTVQVSLDTWMDANQGQQITFGGEKGKVIS